MADVKISALPSATTPLAGTEVLPIVQSATTDQVSVANLTAGRSVSAASLTLTTTPLAVGSGGTGLSTLTAGYIPYGNGTSAFGSSANLFWDATNSRLGIGTTTPGYKLDVSGDARFTSNTFGIGGASVRNAEILTSDANTTYGSAAAQFPFSIRNTDTTANNWAVISFNQGPSSLACPVTFGAQFASPTSADFVFVTAGTQKMRLDASGNLGLGVTPSAWQSGRRAFQINGSTGGGISLHSAAISQAVFGANNYYDGTNYVYLSTGYATLYQQLNGTHFWNIAASGTANALITFTQAMTLDASGNLGIGTTSPSYKLTVSGGNINLDNNQALQWGANNYIYGNGSTNIIVLATNATERARVDSSGNIQTSGGGLLMPGQQAPTSKGAAATLTGAELITGILNTTGTTYTITLPTGTTIEGALTWSANNVAMDWFVINTASGTITIGANGNTTLGSLTLATGTSGHFRIRRTAANTFTVYRLA